MCLSSSYKCSANINLIYTPLGKRKKKAFLDLLLDLNETEKIPMTENELREQVDTFMFAVSLSKIIIFNYYN